MKNVPNLKKMKPKDKAKELYQKFLPYDVEMCDPNGNILDGYLERHAKRCAIICVDEIDRIFVKTTPKDNPYEYLSQLEYWQEVKKEITNL